MAAKFQTTNVIAFAAHQLFQPTDAEARLINRSACVYGRLVRRFKRKDSESERRWGLMHGTQAEHGPMLFTEMLDKLEALHCRAMPFDHGITPEDQREIWKLIRLGRNAAAEARPRAEQFEATARAQCDVAAAGLMARVKGGKAA